MKQFKSESNIQQKTSTIWDDLSNIKNEGDNISEFINDEENFEAIVKSLSEMYEDKNPDYDYCKKIVLKYGTSANLILAYNLPMNKVNLSDIGFTPEDIKKSVPEHDYSMYSDYLVSSWQEKEVQNSREQFRKRVHDTFGPEDARMIAYAMRKPDDERPEHHFNNAYSAVSDVLPKILDPGEVGDRPVGWSEWVDRAYAKDLSTISEFLKENATRCEGEGRTKDADFCKEMAGKIDYKLKGEDVHPGWSDEPSELPATMEYQVGGLFLHCRDIKTALLGGDKVELRLYMHPKLDRMMELVDLFKNKCDERGQRYYFKISQDARSDGFIIYTNYKHVNKQLDVLKEISDERPDLFEGMDSRTKNPFWGEIDGAPKGVFFGEEPARYPRAFEPTAAELGMTRENGYEYSSDDVPFFEGYSYSGLRAEVFEIAFKKWMKEVYHETKKDYEYFIDGKKSDSIAFNSPSDISWPAARRLEQLFREELDKADIDPNNLCFDKYPDKKR